MKHLNRWVYVVVGVVVMLLAGLVYAWTVLQAPIAAMYPHWTKGQLSLTFTITMTAFCIGGFLGGLMQKRCSLRALAWTSAVLFLAGFFIASRAQSLAGLYLGFGVLAGLATGMIYNVVMSSVTCWFPDKQGLISGILLMGFGVSSFIIGKVYTAVTPSDGSDAWRTAFLVFGILLAGAAVIAGIFLAKPDSSWKAPACAKEKTSPAIYEEVPTSRMVKRSSFWMFMAWATFLSAAGLAIISQGTPMALEACPGISMGTVATIVGLLSVFNGVGRILFGALYDRAGRLRTMFAGGITFFSAMLLLFIALKTHSLPVLTLAYVMTGLGYGCVTPINAAFANQFYGRSNYPTNLSAINMNMLVASFGSTVSGMVFDMTQSYSAIILIVMVLIALGTGISCLIRKPVSRD